MLRPSSSGFAALGNWLAIFVAFALLPSEAQAQDDRSEEPASRLLSAPPSGQIAPPVVRTIAPPTLAPADTGPDYVSVETLMEAVGICRRVVSLEQELDTSSLLGNGWGHTQPYTSTLGGRKFESIQYIKGGLTIGLRDFGNFVLCTGVGMIEDGKEIDNLRKKIREEYGAVPMVEEPGLNRLTAKVLKAMPHFNPQNLLVADNYQIEISDKTLTPAEHGLPGIGDLTALMVATNPLPAEFQNYQSPQAK